MIKFEDKTNIFAWYNEELVNPIQDGEGGVGRGGGGGQKVSLPVFPL